MKNPKTARSPRTGSNRGWRETKDEEAKTSPFDPADGDPKDGKKGKPKKGKPGKSQPRGNRANLRRQRSPSKITKSDDQSSRRNRLSADENSRSRGDQRAKEDMERAIEELKKKNHGKASDNQDEPSNN